MLNRLTALIQNWRKGPATTSSFVKVPVMPDAPFFAVGDIHGCFAPLNALMARLDEVAEGLEAIVFVGDYIDRGAQSRQVLEFLFRASKEHPESVVCLMGNHERMMLDFIDDPAGRGAIWLRNGGLDTLASFGITLRQRDTDTDAAVEIANALEAALPPGMQNWLRALPLRWSSGNVHCVHAALSPRRAYDDQRDEVLLWGHPNFMTTPRDDGQFVVHGHTIVDQAGVDAGRIAVDTGAYRTGRLSAVRITAGECRFLTT